MDMPAAPMDAEKSGDSPFYVDAAVVGVDGVVYVAGGAPVNFILALHRQQRPHRLECKVDEIGLAAKSVQPL